MKVDWKNPEARKEYDRQRYQTQKERRMKMNAERRLKIAKWFTEYKKTLSCTECGENHPACIEFHHLDSDEKDGNVSDMAHSGWAKETILKEIEKCDVVCRNCHAKLHYSDRS